MKLDNRTVLITGATAGIGRALTLALLEKGCRIIACGRNEAALAELAKCPRVLPLRGDLQRVGDIEHLAAQVTNKYPDLSVLINNAGVQYLTDFTRQSYDQVLNTSTQEIAINFTAPVLLCALLLPALARQPSAAIVNITTGLALAPKKSSPVYCATKAGLRSFTKSLRYQVSETAPQVRIIEVLPPLVDTDMTRNRGKGKISPAQAAAGILRGIKRGQEEIYVGKSQLLRVVHRLAPSVAERVLRNW